MDKNNSGKNLKGKLTLGLPKTVDISKINDFTIKSKKRASKSKISDKGQDSSASLGNKNLSQDEIEYRKKALENYGKKQKSDNFPKSNKDILNKITQNIQSEEEKKVKPKEEKQEEKKNTESKKTDNVKFEAIEDNFEVKTFDINKKIQQSIKVDLQKAEEERKIQEQLKKEREQVKVKKPKKEFSNDSEDKYSNKKHLKKNKRSKKQIFIIDDESENVRYKKRKKSKIESSSPKEYKKISKEVTLPEMILISDLADRMSEKT